jgi:CspA family cold shock protein
MLTGTIKFFRHDKGYGFISPTNGGQDVFVHIKDTSGFEPAQDVKVSFELAPAQPGKVKAIRVRAA